MRAALVIALGFVAGCDASADYRVEVVRTANTGMHEWFAVGDTAQFVATIYHDPRVPTEQGEQPRSTSVERPDLYEWSVTDTTIAALIDPGIVVIRKSGNTTIKVQTASAVGYFSLNVRSSNP